MKRIIVQRGKENKLKNFYPNLYKDEIKEILGEPGTGDIVEVCDYEYAFLGRGYVVEDSGAFVRMLTTKDEKLDKNFFRTKVQNAWARKKHLEKETNSIRVFYAEGDGLPGLVVDKFDKYLVVQFRNTGIDPFRQEIINALKKVFKPKGIYERSDVETRMIQEAGKKTNVIYGEIPEEIIMEDNGLKYTVDLVEGQKTGFFLDQRDSRKFIRPYINENTKFLDVFSSSGGFSVAALKEGAKKVIAIDKEQQALELAKKNYTLNNFSNEFETMEGDAFSILKTLSGRPEKYDIITLDPPTLIKKRVDVRRGRDMFMKLCDDSFKLLEVGGILGVITCSYYLTLQDLVEVTRMAASKNGYKLQVLGVNYQPEDHSWILHIPETLYLKALWVRIIES